MSKEMLEAFRILEEDKGIKKEDIIDAVTESLRSAYRRRYGQADSAAIEFDEKSGDFRVYTVREVVDEVFDSRLEISLKDALAISSAYELGDNLAGSLLSLPSKPSWKRCASRPEQSPTIPTKNMKMKSCQELWSALIIDLSMSILAALKRSYRNKIRFLVRSLPLMTVSKSLFTR